MATADHTLRQTHKEALVIDNREACIYVQRSKQFKDVLVAINLKDKLRLSKNFAFLCNE